MKYVTAQQYKRLNETRNYFHVLFPTHLVKQTSRDAKHTIMQIFSVNHNAIMALFMK